MSNGRAIIPVDKKLCGYMEYQRTIKPYLITFGIPFIECTTDNLNEVDGALILLAQPELQLSKVTASHILKAVQNGSGLIALGASSIDAREFSEILDEVIDDPQAITEFNISRNHYITNLHKNSERISLYSQIDYKRSLSLKNNLPLIMGEDSCILEVSRYGSGRIALWHTVEWISERILGRLHGMDDLLWRSLVWAAKKPFVLQGMPRFIGMRIDDVWGSWRNISPDNPLLWVDIANKYNLKPWLGVFQNNVNEKTLIKLKKLVSAGRASAFPHAFSGCEWVGSPIPESFIYFDHFNNKPYTDTEIKRNTTRAKAWFDENHLPISSVALAHYYEMGENSLEYIIDWGCEFTGMHMQPNNAYTESAWLRGAPYRMYETGKASSPRPVYYAHYLEFDNPKISNKLYNMVVEIRDICGYEWAPTTNTENTIKNGIAQLKRSFDSFVPGFLFTHESKFIQRMLPEGFEASISGITDALSGYNPIFETADNIYRYVRARNNIRITDVDISQNGDLTIKLRGNNDIETKCIVFNGENENITESWVTIPIVKDYAQVNV